MASNPYQPPVIQSSEPAPVRIRPMKRAAERVSSWLWIYVAVSVLGTAANIIYYASGPGPTLPEAELSARDALLVLTALSGLVVYVTCVVLFARFLYQSNVNARAMKLAAVWYSPAAMVWWYFVPIAALFKPYHAVMNVLRASVPPGDTPVEESRFKTWWAFWVLSNIAGTLSWRLQDEAWPQITFGLVMLPLEVASAVTAIVVVQTLAHRQDKTASMLEGAGSVVSEGAN